MRSDGRTLTRDYRLLLVARVLRSFAFGFMAIVLGIQLEHRGLSARWLGVALGIGVLAASLYGLPVAGLASRFGRRPILAGVGLLMVLTRADLALATQPHLLVLAGATGRWGRPGRTLGPFSLLSRRC